MMYFSTLEITRASPHQLEVIAHEALTADNKTPEICSTLAQVEFAERFEEIHPDIQIKVIKANIKALEQRVIEHLNALSEKQESTFDKIFLLGKIRLISKSDMFQCLEEEIRESVLKALKEHLID